MRKDKQWEYEGDGIREQLLREAANMAKETHR